MFSYLFYHLIIYLLTFACAISAAIRYHSLIYLHISVFIHKSSIIHLLIYILICRSLNYSFILFVDCPPALLPRVCAVCDAFFQQRQGIASTVHESENFPTL